VNAASSQLVATKLVNVELLIVDSTVDNRKNILNEVTSAYHCAHTQPLFKTPGCSFRLNFQLIDLQLCKRNSAWTSCYEISPKLAT